MNISIIGHMYVNKENREVFDYLLEEHEIHFLYPKKWKGEFNEKYENEEGFNTLRFFGIKNNFIPFLPNIKDANVLWIDEEIYYIQTFFILRKYTNIKKIIIRTAQNIEKHSIYRNFMYNYVNKKVHKILAVGKTSADIAIKTLNREVEILPLHVYERFFNIKHEKQNKLTIGFAGRIEMEKGINWFMNIIKNIPFPFKLIIAGDGSKRQEFIDFLNNEKIDYEYRGFIRHGNMINFYKDIDVFINTSISIKNWKEQQGRTVLEAAAAKVFVISSNSGELIHTLKDIGVTVEENNTKSVIDILKKIKSNNHYFKSNIEDSYNKVQKFHKMEIGKQINRIINE